MNKEKKTVNKAEKTSVKCILGPFKVVLVIWQWIAKTYQLEPTPSVKKKPSAWTPSVKVLQKDKLYVWALGLRNKKKH